MKPYMKLRVASNYMSSKTRAFNLAVDILAVQYVKQGIEAEKFRADQPLVQVTYITLRLDLGDFFKLGEVVEGWANLAKNKF